ncbi:hypothetical protein PUNSTDRAFT_42890 [Punctularia strigosozonata HHB-11173 SS5]|uniref:uncharacterized protein n=1 Tax=Punctularia strigosozonata (strain HHB-11173) TaxID=741275 RepID=UPI00044175D2|nr:uncharacterized protein PUNSTDRAFT_42890 [Punctularia strigosozonata HHB-11173 SS5]EIN11720.1 hypothetical protein PUNSTDRAFT_42890 [Punctularia strigosozonata HHB-11173 SS5]
MPDPGHHRPGHSEHGRYAAVKAEGEGRRKTILRVAQEFWGLPPEAKAELLHRSNTSTFPSTAGSPVAQQIKTLPAWQTDEDPFDEIAIHTAGLGILVRTDFTDDDAWQSFLAKLREGEQEFAGATNREDAQDAQEDVQMVVENPIDNASGSTQEEVVMEEGEDGSDDEESEDSPAPIFAVLDSPRDALENMSNLAALRLVNEVGVRPAPPLPAGTSRAKPSHRLIDHDGWQEIYTGKPVWIYDARSNADQTARVVSQTSTDSTYGTATGDSWRARVSHICELQVNMAVMGMKVDFGGLDRWDYHERKRNLEEAVVPL